MESKEGDKKSDEMTGATTHKLTLASHPGKALVKKDGETKHEGHDVFYFELGEIDKAIEIEISKDYPFG